MTLSNDVKEKIRVCIRVNDFLVDRRMVTDPELDAYILREYKDDVAIEFVNDDFITYKEFEDHIYIKDMVCAGSGWRLLNRIIKRADEVKKPLRCMVHIINEQQIRVMEERFKFVCVGLIGRQYYMERMPQ